MIDGVTNADAIPVLERVLQFAGARHRIITGNIANIDTPEYQPVDLSVAGFQEQLSEAIDDRRSRHGARGGRLDVASSREITFTREGLVVAPTPVTMAGSPRMRNSTSMLRPTAITSSRFGT